LAKTKYSDFTILVDIDDVIENLCEAWIHWLNCEYLKNVNWEDVDDWDITKFYPDLTRGQVFAPLHQDVFWRCVKPKPDAIHYLKLLMDEGFDVYLCTTTDYRNVRPKFVSIIEAYFPYIPWSKVIVTSKKQMVKADFLVDDGPHNLEGGDYIKILFDAGHNRKYDEASNGMIRVKNWEQIYAYIHQRTEDMIKVNQISERIKSYQESR